MIWFRTHSRVLMAVLLTAATAAQADVKLNPLLGDGMVLQRGGPVNIWGSADDGEAVTVSFRGHTAKADATGGKFKIAVPAGDAGGPFELTVTGKNTVTLKDVYVGDVWICSGQSNMEWSVGASDKSDKDAVAAFPGDPKLRIYKVGRNPTQFPQEVVPPGSTGWMMADAKTLMGFTAVGGFFGQELRRAMPELPIGLIQTAWGGTRAEAWTSREVLSEFPEYKTELANFDRAVADAANNPPKNDPTSKDKKAKKAAGPPDKNPNAPAVLYNSMIAPLLPYKIKGAIWYQGESNAGKAFAYRQLFPTMIHCWRSAWDSGEFPFYFVQLAPFQAITKSPVESNWAELREAQALTEKNLSNTGMAVIMDLGHESDIHPTPKKPVGERLAYLALAKTYGKIDVVCHGPTFAELKLDGSKAVVRFAHAAGGLVVRELVPSDTRVAKDGRPGGSAWRVKPEGSADVNITGFELAGEDGVYHNATAAVEGDTVVLTSEKVPKPVSVRYGWSQHPLINLFNRAGLPACPFRTDSKPGITEPKK